MCTSLSGKPDHMRMQTKKPLSNILRTAGAVPPASRNVILSAIAFILEPTSAAWEAHDHQKGRDTDLEYQKARRNKNEIGSIKRNSNKY